MMSFEGDNRLMQAAWKLKLMLDVCFFWINFKKRSQENAVYDD